MKPRRQSKAELERIAKSAGVPVAAGVAFLNGHRAKPKPSTLGQQIKDAKKEWAKLSPEQRATVKLQGSREPTRDSLCRKDPNWTLHD